MRNHFPRSCGRSDRPGLDVCSESPRPVPSLEDMEQTTRALFLDMGRGRTNGWAQRTIEATETTKSRHLGVMACVQAAR